MPSPAIWISSDSTNESFGSPISLAPVATPPTTTLGPALQPDTEFESSEALTSPDYVPASPNYVSASPDYFHRSDPESDLEESPEEDPLDDNPSSDYVSETTRLEVQTAPTPPAPLQIVPALPALPHRPAILVLPRQEIPFGRPYRTHPNGITTPPPLSSGSSSEYSSSLFGSSLVAPSLPYTEPSRRRSHYVSSSSSPPPRKRRKILIYSTSSTSLSPSPLVGPSRKRCRSPTTSLLPAAVPAPTSLSSVPDDRLPPRKRFRGSPAASLQEDAVETTIEATVEAAAEPVIPPDHPEQTIGEILYEHEEVIDEMYEHLLEMPVIRFEEIKEELQTLKDRVATSEGDNSNLRERIKAMDLGDKSLRAALRTAKAGQSGMHRRRETLRRS
ncbi:hypothetical protein Tco_0869215 [Tanacetum coccineum]